MNKVYEVTKSSGEVATIEARSEFSAIAKAHKQIVGERAMSSDVTWHGTHAECKRHGYRRPVVVWER
jgi:hypothetical protein